MVKNLKTTSNSSIKYCLRNAATNHTRDMGMRPADVDQTAGAQSNHEVLGIDLLVNRQ